MKSMRKIVVVLLTLAMVMGMPVALAGDEPLSSEGESVITVVKNQGITWLTEVGVCEYLQNQGIQVKRIWQESFTMCIELENGYVLQLSTRDRMIRLAELKEVLEENGELLDNVSRWVRLSDACRILNKIDAGVEGLAYLNLVLTEADSAVLEYYVGDKRVAAYQESLKANFPFWRIKDGQILIKERILFELMNQI